jgi:hypothetical protein
MAKKASLAAGLAVLAFPFVLTTSSCSKKTADTGWKADIKIIDGVKTVRNPETPRYGTFTFDLVEDLVIGDVNKEEYFFPRGLRLSIAGDGTFLVCDYGNRRVQVFDRNGVFIRTVGRLGQGPGEYGFPSGAMVDAAGNFLIDDSRSLVVFSPEGVFQKRILLRTRLSLPCGPGGTIIGTVSPSPRAEGGPKNKLIQLGPDGEVLRTLAEFPACGVVQDLVINHWYTCRAVACPRSADSLFYGFDLDYTIHVVDHEGRDLFALAKAEKQVPISAEEKALTRKEGIGAWSGPGDPEKTDLGMPSHRPFWSRFISDDTGRLYVVRFLTILEKDRTTRDVDVFSRDGLYLYRMTWPFVPQEIKGGYIYEARQDEEGWTKVIRHRIKNWGDFRSE